MSRSPIRPLLTFLFAAGTAIALAVPAGAAATASPAAGAAPDITSVDSSLRSTLGASYAHTWLEGDKIIAGIVDDSSGDAVRALGAEPRAVKYSAATLDSIKARFDSQWTKTAGTKAPEAIAGWGVDPVTNSVVIYVVGADPQALAFANAARAANAAVRVEQIAEAYRPFWNIIGGQAIYGGGYRCSVGFNARNSAGTRYVITAGHCTNLASSWSGVGGSLGVRAGSSFPGNDYGIIQVTSSAAVSTPYVDRYSSGSDVRVTGAAGSSVGQAICRSGSTTGWRCGSVTGVNQTVYYSGYGYVYGLTRTSACAEPGDSGGSFVSNPGTGTTVTARGMTSGGSGNCSVGGTTFFQPVLEPMGVYGLTLYT